MRKNDKGFSVVEAVAILAVISLVSVVGYTVLRKLDGTNYKHAVVSDLNGADSNTILDNFYKSLTHQFHYWNRDACKLSKEASPDDHCQNHAKDALNIVGVSGYAQTMRVKGDNFYIEPVIPSGDESASDIEIDTPSKSKTQAVLGALNYQVKADKLSNSSANSQIIARPSSKDFKVLQSFYSTSTVCETIVASNNSNSDHITVNCTPISVYETQAAQLKPLYDTYVKNRPQYANPQKTNTWLVFHTDNDSYVLPSRTAGYQTATISLEYLNISNGSDERAAAYFYAKGNNWLLLADKQAQSQLPCNYVFPNNDAHLAFMGSGCEAVNGSSQVFQ